MNKWSEHLDIPFPQCRMTGQCCRCSSPSTPAVELLKKAAENSDFARDFFSIFIPYKSIEEAKKINPDIVERSITASRKPDNKVSENNIVFYYCRYISEDNRCLIHEDRPQLCRDYPDSPFLIFAKGCAYEEWSKTCKQKYSEIKQELEKLKDYKKELDGLKYQQKSLNLLNQMYKIPDKSYYPILLLPSLSLVSPGKSWIKTF